MATEHVHIIEDESDIAKLLRYNLSLAGYRVSVSSTGEEGLIFLKQEEVHLILLDLMLPGMNGLEVCKKIKMHPERMKIPIIMVSAKGEESDVVCGLELGADDYITKPFSPQVLVARVKAALRRRDLPERKDEEAVLRVQKIMIHPGRFEVFVEAEKIELTRSEFKLLYFLARRPGWVYTRSQLVDVIHGGDFAVTDRAIDFQMVGLRKKMGSASGYIETVRGIGYRFKEVDTEL